MNIQPTPIAPLAGFIAGAVRNRWLTTDKFEIYVRRGYHNINGECLHTFDVANIVSFQPGSGAFRGLLEDIDALLAASTRNFAGIFIENVLNERLVASLPAMGFVAVAGTSPPCFFRPLRP